MNSAPLETGPDSLEFWMNRYRELALVDRRSQAVAKKITLHLERFLSFYMDTYGHERTSTCLRRDVEAWQTFLQQRHAAATVNNHLASLSGFASWVQSHDPGLFPAGNPVKGIGEISLPPLEPRALDDDQVKSLKNLCDRLEPFYRLKGRHWVGKDASLYPRTRPLRDKAIVFILLSTGLRREELVQLDLDQVQPHTPEALRDVLKVRIGTFFEHGQFACP